MARPTAFLDACVLYPAPIRDLLLELAAGDLYRARWSDAVHEEWIGAVLRQRPDLDRRRLERTRELMNAHIPEAVVTGFESLIEQLALPDPKDRHVLAAAVKGGATVIVTTNLKDFPPAAIDRWDLEALHPDAFLTSRLDPLHPGFLRAVRTVRLRLKMPPKSAEEYLGTLESHGLTVTVRALRSFSRSI